MAAVLISAHELLRGDAPRTSTYRTRMSILEEVTMKSSHRIDGCAARKQREGNADEKKRRGARLCSRPTLSSYAARIG